MPDISWDCGFPHPISHEYSNANTSNLCLHGFHSDPTRFCVKPGCCSSSLFAGPVTMMTMKSLWRRAASIWRSSTARLRPESAFFQSPTWPVRSTISPVDCYCHCLWADGLTYIYIYNYLYIYICFKTHTYRYISYWRYIITYMLYIYICMYIHIS